ncbi:MAG TPA: SMP-30/gluconolactonase/LRE family protein [Candidatus Eisenbacteria bacterium]|nr:SMP-30/gluconolactonase/LRE family protein [Candidatus Eisenbacteria bacterium]
MGRAIRIESGAAAVRTRAIAPAIALAAAVALAFAAPGAAAAEPPAGPADAAVDLATREGLDLVRGAWRVHEAALVPVDFRAPGPDRKPTGAPNRTYDIEPKAGARDFDDRAWATIEPTALDTRLSSGKVCFEWYRVSVTVPASIGGFDPTGSTVVLETVVDDYAEIWVDGALPRELGQRGGNLVAGWNAPNRLVVGRNVRPGQRIQLAVFGMNGPISDPPSNYVWMRSARLEFYRLPRAIRPEPVPVAVDRRDPALDAIVPADVRAERLAEGFQFTEGPVWTPDGALLFSDPNANRIYRWSERDGLSLFRDRSGYDGADVAEYGQPGSNGLAFDPRGRLSIDEHGRRRVVRLEADGGVTVLADRYDGKRLNSPNDLVYRSDGVLYFTDPPFGLPKFHDDPRRELPHYGLYRLAKGRLTLESKEFTGPNGVALSPDESALYLANWDEKRKVVWRFDVRSDGSLANGRLFYDMTSSPGEIALDGLKVDRSGNIYVAGPGGIWILSPDAKHLGTLRLPELAANFAWGDDGRTLFVTARTGLYRLRLNVPGAGGLAAAR